MFSSDDRRTKNKDRFVNGDVQYELFKSVMQKFFNLKNVDGDLTYSGEFELQSSAKAINEFSIYAYDYIKDYNRKDLFFSDYTYNKFKDKITWNDFIILSMIAFIRRLSKNRITFNRGKNKIEIFIMNKSKCTDYCMYGGVEFNSESNTMYVHDLNIPEVEWEWIDRFAKGILNIVQFDDGKLVNSSYNRTVTNTQIDRRNTSIQEQNKSGSMELEFEVLSKILKGTISADLLGKEIITSLHLGYNRDAILQFYGKLSNRIGFNLDSNWSDKAHLLWDEYKDRITEEYAKNITLLSMLEIFYGTRVSIDTGKCDFHLTKYGKEQAEKDKILGTLSFDGSMNINIPFSRVGLTDLIISKLDRFLSELDSIYVRSTYNGNDDIKYMTKYDAIQLIKRLCDSSTGNPMNEGKGNITVKIGIGNFKDVYAKIYESISKSKAGYTSIKEVYNELNVEYKFLFPLVLIAVLSKLSGNSYTPSSEDILINYDFQDEHTITMDDTKIVFSYNLITEYYKTSILGFIRFMNDIKSKERTSIDSFADGVGIKLESAQSFNSLMDKESIVQPSDTTKDSTNESVKINSSKAKENKDTTERNDFAAFKNSINRIIMYPKVESYGKLASDLLSIISSESIPIIKSYGLYYIVGAGNSEQTMSDIKDMSGYFVNHEPEFRDKSLKEIYNILASRFNSVGRGTLLYLSLFILLGSYDSCGIESYKQFDGKDIHAFGFNEKQFGLSVPKYGSIEYYNVTKKESKVLGGNQNNRIRNDGLMEMTGMRRVLNNPGCLSMPRPEEHKGKLGWKFGIIVGVVTFILTRCMFR